jgi:hypothetical protein
VGADGVARYRRIDRITPAGMLLALGAQLHAIVAQAGKDKKPGMLDEGQRLTRIATGAAGAAGKLVADQPFLKGIAGVSAALASGSTKAEAYAENLTGSVVPAAWANSIAASDPTVRDPRGVVDALKARTGIGRGSVPPRLTPLGDTVKNTQSFLTALFDPTKPQPVDSSRLLAELDRLNLGLSDPHDITDSTEVNGRRTRTDDERDTYRRLAGPAMKQTLTALVASDEYRSLRDPTKVRLFEAVASRVRSEAAKIERGEDSTFTDAGEVIENALGSVAEKELTPEEKIAFRGLPKLVRRMVLVQNLLERQKLDTAAPRDQLPKLDSSRRRQ